MYVCIFMYAMYVYLCTYMYVCICMQVSIGESTCAAKIFNGPGGLFPGSTALLEAAELSQIAVPNDVLLLVPADPDPAPTLTWPWP